MNVWNPKYSASLYPSPRPFSPKEAKRSDKLGSLYDAYSSLDMRCILLFRGNESKAGFNNQSMRGQKFDRLDSTNGCIYTRPSHFWEKPGETRPEELFCFPVKSLISLAGFHAFYSG